MQQICELSTKSKLVNFKKKAKFSNPYSERRATIIYNFSYLMRVLPIKCVSEMYCVSCLLMPHLVLTLGISHYHVLLHTCNSYQLMRVDCRIMVYRHLLLLLRYLLTLTTTNMTSITISLKTEQKKKVKIQC